MSKLYSHSCSHLTTPLCNRQLPHGHFVSLGVNTATEWSALRRMLLEEIWSQPRKWALEREWGLWVGIFTGPVDSFPPGELQPKWTRGEPSKGTSLNLFGTSNWFCRRQFFPWTRAREWFWDDPSTLNLLCTLFLSCSHLRIFHFDFRVRVTLLWESNAATDLTGDRAQAVRQAMGSGCKYREALLPCCCSSPAVQPSS